MTKSSTASLDDLANDYAVRWSAQRPAPEPVRPATRPERRAALEAAAVFLHLTEFLPVCPRCGIAGQPRDRAGAACPPSGEGTRSGLPVASQKKASYTHARDQRSCDSHRRG